ncbi:tyrosine-type recombinase/integrase [Perlucidibaca aquatica]|uniref:tyrosine-type recombinase/integrase n=1 Tax=Perlucidibaca aquatica TaxID=1852776 RepID=UPI000839FADD|nr:integrase arm-type DNA-binding domain-containing protein [Perlucidibaca aquatica]
MARQVVPLTDTKCEAARYNPDGGKKLSDGGGLFLLLNPSGSKSWRMKYTRPGDRKEDSLVIGSYPSTTLKMARKRREEVKELLAQGIDPKSHLREQQARLKADHENSFEAVARLWHKAEAKKKKWSEDYTTTYLERMEANLFQALGRRPVTSLKTRDLIQPVRKIEERGALELAQRMQQAICRVMRYAVQQGLIDSNPALDLAGNSSSPKVKHHPALPEERLPEFLIKLEGYSGRSPVTRLAVQIALMVFIRSSELRFARWQEIDLERSIWTVPASREPIANLEGKRVVPHSYRGSKMREEHLVPLSRQVVRLLREVYEITGRQELVFPGSGKNGKCVLSENTINSALRRLGFNTKTDVCGHGFRSMANGALRQSKLWQSDAIRLQMSHRERNSVEAAYIHSAEFIEERRQMMQWWSDYLDANRQERVTPYDFAHPRLRAVAIRRA